PEWQRGGAVSFDRAGGPFPGRSRAVPNRGLRLVYARRLVCDRRRCLEWRNAGAAAAGRRDDAPRELPDGSPALCRVGCTAPVPLHPSLACRRSARARHARRLWHWRLARRGLQAVGPVRPRFLCRRLRGAELRRLLVLSPLRRRPSNARRDLLWSERPRRCVGITRVAARGALWARKDHGVHAPAVQPAADSRPADADPAPPPPGV